MSFKKFRRNIAYLFKNSLKENFQRTNEKIDNLPYEIAGEFNLESENINFPKIMTIEETIDEIIKNKKSVSRYGDGEFMYLFDGQKADNAYFRTKYSEKLKQRLSEVLISNNKNHLVCIWDFFGSLEKFTDGSKIGARMHMSYFREYMKSYINPNYIYGNAFISRPYLAYKDISQVACIFKKIKEIWKNRDIIIIEGELSRLGVGNDLFDTAKSVKRILCPAENAFEKYDLILEKATLLDKNCLILIALGMSATILAYDLCKLGFWAIDIGHIDIEYECFLKNSRDYKVVKNKYVNDANIREADACNDEKYLSEIKEEIK